MLLQKNIVKKYLALLPDEQTQEAWKWVREPSLDPFIGIILYLENLRILKLKPDMTYRACNLLSECQVHCEHKM